MNRIEQLLAFLQKEPKDPFLRHALALEYIKLNDDEKAIQLLIALLTDTPTYIGSYYQLAKLYEKHADFEQAKYWYKQGMSYAKLKNEKHSYNELSSGLDELEY